MIKNSRFYTQTEGHNHHTTLLLTILLRLSTQILAVAMEQGYWLGCADDADGARDLVYRYGEFVYYGAISGSSRTLTLRALPRLVQALQAAQGSLPCLGRL